MLPAGPANAACGPIFALLGLCPTGGPGSCLTLLASLGLCKDPAPPSGTTTPPPPTDVTDTGYIDASGAYKLPAGGNPYGLTVLPTRTATDPVLPRLSGALPIPVGNDISLAANQNLATPAQLAFIAHDSHWQFVRRDMQWAFVEPVQNQWHFHDGGYDDAYAALIKQGIRPIWQLQSSPRWAAQATDACPSSNGSWCPHSPPSPAFYPDWENFVKRLIQRYPLSGGVIIWNEPNFGEYNWDATASHSPDPVSYTNLLHASWDAVKASVHPQIPVLGGALGQILTDTSVEMDTKAFLHGMLAAGAGNYMDALSFHPYPAAPDFNYLYQTFADIQSELTAAGFPNKRLFIDEWGVRLGDHGVPDEATRTNQEIAFLDELTAHDPRLPGADRVDGLSYFVSLSGRTSNGSDLNDAANYSWITAVAAASPTATAFTPRPVYCAMRAHLAGQPAPASCPPFIVSAAGNLSARKLSKHAAIRRIDLRRWTQRTRGSGLPRESRTYGARGGTPSAAGRGGGVGGFLSGV